MFWGRHMTSKRFIKMLPISRIVVGVGFAAKLKYNSLLDTRYLRALKNKSVWIPILPIIILSVGLVLLTNCSRGGEGGAEAYGVSGTVTSSEAGLAGVTMTLSGAGTGTTLTDNSGKYAFSGLANGYYTITPAKIGYTFSPPASVLDVNGADTPGLVFTAATSTTNAGLCSDFSTVLVTANSQGSTSSFSIGTAITFQMQVTNISGQDQTRARRGAGGGLVVVIILYPTVVSGNGPA